MVDQILCIRVLARIRGAYAPADSHFSRFPKAAGNPIAGKMSNVVWLRGMMKKAKPLVTCLNIAT
jgi:hypothetical protein